MFDSGFACNYQLTHLKYDDKTNIYILSKVTYTTLSKQAVRNALTFFKKNSLTNRKLSGMFLSFLNQLTHLKQAVGDVLPKLKLL